MTVRQEVVRMEEDVLMESPPLHVTVLLDSQGKDAKPVSIDK